MPRRIAAALLLLLVASSAEAQTKRILIVGDSWAAQSWTSGAFQDALDAAGLGAYEAHGGPTTIGGSTAAQWATAPFLALITQELQAHPSLDIVHLWMGGNDFLGCGGCDPVALLDQIAADVQTVVDHILTIRPNANIVHATYDTIPSGPSGIEVLSVTRMIDQANLTGTFFVLDLYGVLDHVFGFPPNFGPGDRPLPGGFPNYVPLLGGEPTLGSDPLTFADAIHPTTASYTALVGHGVDEFYAAWLATPPISVPVWGPGAPVVLWFLLMGAAAPRIARARAATRVSNELA